MGEPLNDFEDYAIGVVAGVAACVDAWSALAAAGVPDDDLGIVASGVKLAGGPIKDGLVINGRTVALQPIDADGSPLYASRGFPADLVAQARNGAGRGRSSFDGLISEREGRALADAIAAAGASIWVRTRGPEAARRAAAVLLRISTERVRTFSRPADHERPDAASDRDATLNQGDSSL